MLSMFSVKNFVFWLTVNSLSHDKILDQSNMKDFAEDKINVTEKLKFVLGRVENIVRKEIKGLKVLKVTLMVGH